MENTIKILREMDGQELKESRIPELVCTVYSDAKEEITKDIERSKEEALDLFNNLQPLKKNEGENQFYKMFQGLEAVPQRFINQVYELIDNGRGIEINRYLVPVPYWKFLPFRKSLEVLFIMMKKLKVGCVI